MNLQESIRRILREEYIPTETDYLGWGIPRKLYDELEDIGIKRWNKENDKVYIAEFQFDTKSVVFEILDSTGEAYFNSLFPIPSSYKSYHTKKIKDLPTSIKYFILRRFEQEWVNIMDKYDDDGKIIQENIRRILREEMELNPTERVYDYDPGRDTVPERLPFDIDKLVNSGVVFVTPAINGNPKSKNYKKWMKTPHTHLISLYNVENSSEDGWILKAITKRASTGQLKGNFVDKIYDGKYNQILWSLEKLGINPMDMLIDMNIQENIRRILKEESINLKKDPVSYYYYNYLNEKPIEYKELYLVPTWTGERIEWEVDNPNDYSYSRDLINEVLRDEFKSFCDITNTDYQKYYQLSSWMEKTPSCYISKKDRKHINVNGKKIKHIDFSGIRYGYEFDFDYKRTSVTSYGEELEVYVYGNITNLIKTDLQYDEKIDREEISPRYFINDMLESDYDLWQEKLYDILLPIYNIFYNNPRIFDNRYDFFNVGLQQTP